MNLEEAANQLELTLDQVNDSLTDTQMLGIRDDLLAYKRSLPWGAEFKELRRLADEAFDDLGKSVNQAVLKRMRERSKDLSKYVETFAAVTANAEKDIDQLRLKLIRQVTQTALEVAQSVREVKTSLDVGDLDVAGNKTQEALDKVLKLIDEVAQKTS